MPSLDSPEPEVTFMTDVVLPPSLTEETVASLVGYILAAEGVQEFWHLGVRFVDDPTMQAAHVEFMGIDTPTDIMTFPYDDGDDEAFGFDDTDEWPEQASGGDLMISVDRATENARLAGWDTEQELFFLIAHGVLHLLGWDDATDDDRGKMLHRQAELLSEWRESPEATR
jgi:probable rRNA maturation factor